MGKRTSSEGAYFRSSAGDWEDRAPGRRRPRPACNGCVFSGLEGHESATERNQAADAERARRVEVYAAWVERHGRLYFEASVVMFHWHRWLAQGGDPLDFEGWLDVAPKPRALGARDTATHKPSRGGLGPCCRCGKRDRRYSACGPSLCGGCRWHTSDAGRQRQREDQARLWQANGRLYEQRRREKAGRPRCDACGLFGRSGSPECPPLGWRLDGVKLICAACARQADVRAEVQRRLGLATAG